MKKKFFFHLTLFFSAFIMLFLFDAKYAEASSISNVNTTVKISVCGNEVVENGEDCESEDLNGQTCQGLGLTSGTLVCDIACSFDTSSCISTTPTPTPTPTTSTTTSSSSVASTPTESPTVTPTTFPTPILKPILPSVLQIFDLDGSGKIELKEVYPTAKNWVDEWRNALLEEIATAKGETIKSRKDKECDINHDARCDLKDFSILMSYVEK